MLNHGSEALIYKKVVIHASLVSSHLMLYNVYVCVWAPLLFCVQISYSTQQQAPLGFWQGLHSAPRGSRT